MDKTKLDAIAALINVFSEKLKLEPCKTIADAVHLLHTVVNYIETGTLQYKSHEHFGYIETVEYLRAKVDDVFYRALCPLLANDENEFECTKILLALLYAFRLERTDIFQYSVFALPAEDHSQIAKLVEYLDSPGNWTSPEAWPEILARPEKSVCCSKLDVSFVESVSSDCKDVFDVESTVKTVAFRNSPITSVLQSPRGSEIKLQRRVKELTELLDRVGADLNESQMKRQLLEDECNKLGEMNSKLEKKMLDLRIRNRLLEPLEYQVEELIQLNSDFAKENNDLLMEREISLENRRRMAVERDNTMKELELVKNERDTFAALLKKRDKEFEAEIIQHNQHREALRELKQKYATEKSSWESEIKKHR